jgi:hypothetical protein
MPRWPSSSDLEQYRERQRNQQRHPKKYFVAKRLREPEA